MPFLGMSMWSTGVPAGVQGSDWLVLQTLDLQTCRCMALIGQKSHTPWICILLPRYQTLDTDSSQILSWQVRHESGKRKKLCLLHHLQTGCQTGNTLHKTFTTIIKVFQKAAFVGTVTNCTSRTTRSRGPPGAETRQASAHPEGPATGHPSTMTIGGS